MFFDFINKPESTDESVLIIALYINNKNKVFAPLSRSNWFQDPKWRIPGGGVDPQEIPLVAAKRELFEETGLTLSTIKEMSEWCIKKPGRENKKKLHYQHIFVGLTDSSTSFTPKAKDGKEMLTNVLFPLEEVNSCVLNNQKLCGFSILEAHRHLLIRAFHNNFGF